MATAAQLRAKHPQASAAQIKAWAQGSTRLKQMQKGNPKGNLQGPVRKVKVKVVGNPRPASPTSGKSKATSNMMNKWEAALWSHTGVTALSAMAPEDQLFTVAGFGTAAPTIGNYGQRPIPLMALPTLLTTPGGSTALINTGLNNAMIHAFGSLNGISSGIASRNAGQVFNVLRGNVGPLFSLLRWTFPAVAAKVSKRLNRVPLVGKVGSKVGNMSKDVAPTQLV